MSKEFEDKKVKAGNLDNEGFIHIKVESDGGGGTGGDIPVVHIPDSFSEKYLFNPECYNTGISITDEEDIAVCREIADQVFNSDNGPMRIEFSGYTYYPEVYMNKEYGDLVLTIISKVSTPQLGNALMTFCLCGFEYDKEYEEYSLEIGVYELTPKVLS